MSVNTLYSGRSQSFKLTYIYPARIYFNNIVVMKHYSVHFQECSLHAVPFGLKRDPSPVMDIGRICSGRGKNLITKGIK